jgi:hypothetical protein
MMIILAGCKQATTTTPSIATEAPTATDTPRPENEAAHAVLKTAMGDFLIVTARDASEVNGVKPGAGEKILLVILSRPGQERLEPGGENERLFHCQRLIHSHTLGNGCGLST